MLSSVISLFFGVLSFIASIPVLLPVIGLGLGANGYIKESKKEGQKKSVKVISSIGMICCGLSVLMFFIRRL